MDKRLKIQVELLDNQSFNYNVLEGSYNGIFVDIMNSVGGNFKTDDEWTKRSPIGYKLWIVVHPVEAFLCGGQKDLGENVFAQDLLKAKVANGEIKEILPIIHISTTTIFLPSMYTMAPLHRYIPRYHLIIDNSIWNYHVSIFDQNEIEAVLPKDEDDPNTKFVKDKLMSFRESFFDALVSIKNNYERYLYGLEVAREYADLNARMTSQSYLIGSHAKGVSPFVFHSEHAVKYMINNEFVKKNAILKKIKNQKWRILLVDDKARTEMGCIPSLKPKDGVVFNECGESLPWNCKLAIIEKILCHCIGWDGKIGVIDHRSYNDTKKISSNCQILIEYAQSLKEADEAIVKRKYDIVLLDYLLDEPNGLHYGYELLDAIYKDQDRNEKNEDGLKYHTIKPHHHLRLYCMFISAYSSAVHDQLLAEGLNQSEKYWFINLGACPTNTPQLFLYNLLKLMDKRIEDSHIGRLSINGIVEVLDDIYNKDNYIRKNAGELYQKIQSLQYYYRNLLQDYDISVGKENIFETTKSVLVTHFLNDHINMGGLLEHLAQLVHLTAFGTIRQWPEMWEEYLYLRSQLEAQLIFKDDKIKFSKLCDKIEEYILKLKSSAL